MDYLREVAAFHRVAMNTGLKPAEQALWHALMFISYSLGFPACFDMRMNVLMLEVNADRRTIRAALNTLEEAGLLIVTENGNGLPDTYELLPIASEGGQKEALGTEKETEKTEEKGDENTLRTEAISEGQKEGEAKMHVTTPKTCTVRCKNARHNPKNLHGEVQKCFTGGSGGASPLPASPLSSPLLSPTPPNNPPIIPPTPLPVVVVAKATPTESERAGEVPALPDLSGLLDTWDNDDDDGGGFTVSPAEAAEYRRAVQAIEDKAAAYGLPFHVGDIDRAMRLKNEYTEDWLLAAIDRMSLRERRSWGTVEAILRAWKKQGYVDDPARSPPEKRDLRPPVIVN